MSIDKLDWLPATIKMWTINRFKLRGPHQSATSPFFGWKPIICWTSFFWVALTVRAATGRSLIFNNTVQVLPNTWEQGSALVGPPRRARGHLKNPWLSVTPRRECHTRVLVGDLKSRFPLRRGVPQWKNLAGCFLKKNVAWGSVSFVNTLGSCSGRRGGTPERVMTRAYGRAAAERFGARSTHASRVTIVAGRFLNTKSFHITAVQPQSCLHKSTVQNSPKDAPSWFDFEHDAPSGKLLHKDALTSFFSEKMHSQLLYCSTSRHRQLLFFKNDAPSALFFFNNIHRHEFCNAKDALSGLFFQSKMHRQVHWFHKVAPSVLKRY